MAVRLTVLAALALITTSAGVAVHAQSSGVGNGCGGFSCPDSVGFGLSKPAVKPRLIAGGEVRADQFPPETRHLREDDYVIIAIRVSAEGKPMRCQIYRRSRDAQANLKMCQIALEQFLFEPARDADGNPIESIYFWKQRWWSDPVSPPPAPAQPAPAHSPPAAWLETDSD